MGGRGGHDPGWELQEPSPLPQSRPPGGAQREPLVCTALAAELHTDETIAYLWFFFAFVCLCACICVFVYLCICVFVFVFVCQYLGRSCIISRAIVRKSRLALKTYFVSSFDQPTAFFSHNFRLGINIPDYWSTKSNILRAAGNFESVIPWLTRFSAIYTRVQRRPKCINIVCGDNCWINQGREQVKGIKSFSL